VHGKVELTFVVVHAECCSVKTDNISEAEHDGKVFEAVSVHDDARVVGALGACVERWVSNFERANIEVFGAFVGESGINDDTVNVMRLSLRQ